MRDLQKLRVSKNFLALQITAVRRSYVARSIGAPYTCTRKVVSRLQWLRRATNWREDNSAIGIGTRGFPAHLNEGSTTRTPKVKSPLPPGVVKSNALIPLALSNS